MSKCIVQFIAKCNQTWAKFQHYLQHRTTNFITHKLYYNHIFKSLIGGERGGREGDREDERGKGVIVGREENMHLIMCKYLQCEFDEYTL